MKRKESKLSPLWPLCKMVVCSAFAGALFKQSTAVAGTDAELVALVIAAGLLMFAVSDLKETRKRW